ncbi:hypothetical protein NDU88_005234 [Pleurodeles waltl]|uniref:Uncharacterized protein n=1 Tax=Pleurodeles waltl TaxID=8319 RepID=A0AAV7LM40_PLEWA|nr:hypothetical protein NDU88_005234 [Pleurodeles waltl]
MNAFRGHGLAAIAHDCLKAELPVPLRDRGYRGDPTCRRGHHGGIQQPLTGQRNTADLKTTARCWQNHEGNASCSSGRAAVSNSAEALERTNRCTKHDWAIAQPKVMAAQQALSSPSTVPDDPPAMYVTDRILQEITAVGRRFEAMDLKIMDLFAASVSIRTDIACFSDKVADLDQHFTKVEDHVRTLPKHGAELQSLREKLTDLEDRS